MNQDFLQALKHYKVKMIHMVSNGSVLNAYVKQIYVINMKQDVRKRRYIQILFQKYNIDYHLVIVDKVEEDVYQKLFQQAKLSIQELGCTMSHMWCLMHMLKHQFENAIVFEDDVVFSKTFVEDFAAIMDTHPTMDFLLLGAHDYSFSRTNYQHVAQQVYRPRFNEDFPLYGAHANYYSFNGAKRMFYIRATNLSFFDNEYKLMFDSLEQSYICSPNLVITNMNESGISETHKKDFFTQHEHVYYTSCFKEFNIHEYHLLYTNLLDPSLYREDMTLEQFVEACLEKTGKDADQIQALKNRCSLDFFTMAEVLYMLAPNDSKQSL